MQHTERLVDVGLENESIARHANLLDYADRLRDYGREHNLPMLTTAAWPGGSDDGWTMAALAVKLYNGLGAFYGISGPLQMFLALSEVGLARFHGIKETSNQQDQIGKSNGVGS